MMNDIKKILEAVSNGLIAPEEGERLIAALMEKEEKGEKSEKKEKEAEFLLNKDEVIEGDLVLSGKKVLIEGEITEDAVLMYCDTIFSGKVGGDFVVIGGRVKFEGGVVGEDLVLIGSKAEGEPEEVYGEKVKVMNFLANGILMAISPVLRALGISSLGRKFRKGDTLVIEEDQEVNVIVLKKLIVNAHLKSRKVQVEYLEVNGELESEEIQSKKVVVNGRIKAKSIKCEKLQNNGKVLTESLDCEKITGQGEVSQEGL